MHSYESQSWRTEVVGARDADCSTVCAAIDSEPLPQPLIQFMPCASQLQSSLSWHCAQVRGRDVAYNAV